MGSSAQSKHLQLIYLHTMEASHRRHPLPPDVQQTGKEGSPARDPPPSWRYCSEVQKGHSRRTKLKTWLSKGGGHPASSVLHILHFWRDLINIRGSFVPMKCGQLVSLYKGSLKATCGSLLMRKHVFKANCTSKVRKSVWPLPAVTNRRKKSWLICSCFFWVIFSLVWHYN